MLQTCIAVFELITETEKTELMCDRLEWRIFQNSDAWSTSWVSLIRETDEGSWTIQMHETLNASKAIPINGASGFVINDLTEVRRRATFRASSPPGRSPSLAQVSTWREGHANANPSPDPGAGVKLEGR